MKERVVVAMSGGVDSSVAAALLKKQGYEVIGITMCFNLMDSPDKRPTCCGMEAIEDARRVAHKLGIRHYVVDMQVVLEKYVIRNFCAEYLKGRTPNPCVRCNQYIKFDALLKKALALGATYLATGHYARIYKVPSTLPNRQAGKYQVPSYQLKKAKDVTKDQSYFLYRLSQKQLKQIIFPLGNYTKARVRQLAKEFRLHIAEKSGSQEICFLSGINYREFLKSRGTKIKPGFIVDKEGNVLGKHQGTAFYTIGQREGIGIARGFPLYVQRIEPQTNRIFVGPKGQVYKSAFLVKNVNFIQKQIKKKIALKVKIRYNHKEMPAEIRPLATKLRVCFRKPQFAITPGQSAVFYDKDNVLGGGIIDKVVG